MSKIDSGFVFLIMSIMLSTSFAAILVYIDIQEETKIAVKDLHMTEYENANGVCYEVWYFKSGNSATLHTLVATNEKNCDK